MSQHTLLDLPKLVQLIEESISQEHLDNARLIAYLKECDQLGIEVLPLDINKSEVSCSIEDRKNLRIGFSLLISKAEQFIEDILTERQQNGPFQSFQEFCERIDLNNVPEEFITRCIQAGAFDSIETSRARLFKNRETIIQTVSQANIAKTTGQLSLFAMLQSASGGPTAVVDLPNIEDWTEEEKIAYEKEATGFSFTEYLFRREETSVDEEPSVPLPEFTVDEREFSFSQEIESEEAYPMEIRAQKDITKSSNAEADETLLATFIIQLLTTTITEQMLLRIREIIQKYPGNSRVLLELIDDRNQKTYIRAHADYSVQISEELVEELETLIGKNTTRTQ